MRELLEFGNELSAWNAVRAALPGGEVNRGANAQHYDVSRDRSLKTGTGAFLF